MSMTNSDGFPVTNEPLIEPRHVWPEETQYGYPPALAKACMDDFIYMLRLRSGEVWRFQFATPISREWVTLECADQSFDDCPLETKRPPFKRGVDVRVADIIWVADAPYGS